MWLSTMMKVGRPVVCRKTPRACSMRSTSLASPTRRTFHPYPRNRVRDVLREGDARVSLDGDVIVVVEPAEVVEAEVSRQRRGLRRDAFHHAAVPAHGVDTVVEDVEPRPVVSIREPLLRDRHADARGDALAERARGRLDARYPVVLRMSGALAVELAESPRHRSTGYGSC